MLSRPRPNRMPVALFPTRSPGLGRAPMPGVREAPVTASLAIDASRLPGDFHAAPMDRLIVASARQLCVPVVPCGRCITAYAQDGHADANPR